MYRFVESTVVHDGFGVKLNLGGGCMYNFVCCRNSGLVSGDWVEKRRRVRVREKGLGLVFNISRHGDRLAAV